eukprot:4953295-Alexandrium_andersonii.AAC.1
MSASLVGSEMCIRDSLRAARRRARYDRRRCSYARRPKSICQRGQCGRGLPSPTGRVGHSGAAGAPT